LSSSEQPRSDDQQGEKSEAIGSSVVSGPDCQELAMAVESTLTQIDEHLDTLDDQLRRLHSCRNGGADFSEDLAAATNKRRAVERPTPAESETLLVNMFLHRLRETLSDIAQTTGCKRGINTDGKLTDPA